MNQHSEVAATSQPLGAHQLIAPLVGFLSRKDRKRTLPAGMLRAMTSTIGRRTLISHPATSAAVEVVPTSEDNSSLCLRFVG